MLSAAATTGPGWLLGSLITIVVFAIAATVAYTFLTRRQGSEQSSLGIVRPMVSLILVGGLLILAGASFSIEDPQTRNLLIGGIVASASGAVAFYFASRGAEDARKDLLNAALGTETVPKLVDMTVAQAQAVMSTSPLMLKTPMIAKSTDSIKTQNPDPGSTAQRGSVITVAV
jgi:PASTA domain.